MAHHKRSKPRGKLTNKGCWLERPRIGGGCWLVKFLEPFSDRKRRKIADEEVDSS